MRYANVRDLLEVLGEQQVRQGQRAPIVIEARRENSWSPMVIEARKENSWSPMVIEARQENSWAPMSLKPDRSVPGLPW